MKNILIILLLITVCPILVLTNSIICSCNVLASDKINCNDIENSVNRIINDIDNFNELHKNEYERIILKYFPDSVITKVELDSLIIVGEPCFTVANKCRIPASEVLGTKRKINYDCWPTWYYGVKLLDTTQEIYTSLLPITTLISDSIRMSFRVYTKDKKLRYFIELFPHSGIIYNQRRSYEAELRNIEKYGADSSSKNKYYPYDMKIFTIDNFINIYSPYFHRYCIHNNKVYLINLMTDKFKNLSVEKILKDHINEIEDCEINNYLIDKK